MKRTERVKHPEWMKHSESAPRPQRTVIAAGAMLCSLVWATVASADVVTDWDMKAQAARGRETALRSHSPECLEPSA